MGFDISSAGLHILALFSLIPIWLCRGRKGYDGKAFRWFCYAFYPAHMLLLALIR